MDAHEIYQYARKGTASGRGASYWELPMVCGRKAALTEKHKDRYASMDRSGALAVGSFYHFLLQIWQEGKLDADLIIDTSEIGDPDWSEAVRLFNFYTGQFRKDSWGEVIGTEVMLPVNDTHRQRIEQFFGIEGDDCPTGQIDLLVRMNKLDVLRVEMDYDLDLRGPGLYIIDYKTAAARCNAESAKGMYTETVQAMTYPTLWNIAGGEQVQGMIFDVLVKHRNLGDNSIQAWFAPTCPSHRQIVRAAVRVARASKIRARANPYACYYKGYECHFLKNAECSRM
ncbi:hypothetical protein Q3G72_026182 [Acer saccharum]|nr:hypothetical protein Q3G72_020550 [Acer saccharum]KAK1548635.1 hypothetical protein Q3G72_026182 [Acer saccharum]